MQKNYTLFFILFICLIFYSCEPNVEDLSSVQIQNSELSFKTYISLGNSLTAGYADGSLYPKGQDYAYPVLLAKKMQLVQADMDSFNIPRINETLYPEGFLNPRIHIKGDPENFSVAIAHNLSTDYDTNDPLVFLKKDNLWSSNKVIHNLGFAGLKVKELIKPNLGNVNNLDDANIYYVRIEPNNPTTQEGSSRTIMERVKQHCPTFFTLWIGANDILGYATSGGEGSDTSITPLAEFESAYLEVLDDLSSSCNNPKGVLLGVPHVKNAPFFTFLVEDNTLVHNSFSYIRIKDSEGNIRFCDTSTDLLPITSIGAFNQYYQDHIIPAFNISTNTFDTSAIKGIFPNKNILDKDEIAKVKDMADKYNTFIKFEAEKRGLAFVDVSHILEQITEGIIYNGADVSSDFIRGGIFSLDGIHLTPRGNAFVANTIINAIYITYGIKLAKYDILDFKGVIFE